MKVYLLISFGDGPTIVHGVYKSLEDAKLLAKELDSTLYWRILDYREDSKTICIGNEYQWLRYRIEKHELQ